MSGVCEIKKITHADGSMWKISVNFMSLTPTGARERNRNTGNLPTCAESVASVHRRRKFAVNLTFATLPDIFENAPKPIKPRTHAWLDVAVTAYFSIAGALCLARGNKRAATAAFVNAGMVAGVSLLTDYRGDGSKPLSFKMHGTMDLIQAATAGAAPVLFGFADEPSSAIFYGQAGSEIGVVALTDWDAADRQQDVIDFAA